MVPHLMSSPTPAPGRPSWLTVVACGEATQFCSTTGLSVAPADGAGSTDNELPTKHTARNDSEYRRLSLECLIVVT